MTTVELGPSFRHEALHYGSAEQFVSAVEAFLRPGVEAGEAALVVVESSKLPLLETRLGPNTELVAMDEIGRNPGRIISLWKDFLDAHRESGATIWGVGEPIFASRSPEELIECQIHERLLNLAFSQTPVRFYLACPYDVVSLPDDVIRESEKSHAWLGAHKSSDFRLANGWHVNGSLPPPPPEASLHLIARHELSSVRELVKQRAGAAGVSEHRLSDLELAVSEIAVNSVLYSGGGELVLWSATNKFLCEFRDKGTIDNPLVGRFRPQARLERGRGIWLAHQLADLVQLRSGPQGTTIRLTFNCPTAV